MREGRGEEEADAFARRHAGTMADRSSTKYFDGVNPEEYIVDYGSMEDRAIDWVQGK